jgi:hypothetical protein
MKEVVHNPSVPARVAGLNEVGFDDGSSEMWLWQPSLRRVLVKRKRGNLEMRISNCELRETTGTQIFRCPTALA